jgi:HlyD family secretion protein
MATDKRKRRQQAIRWIKRGALALAAAAAVVAVVLAARPQPTAVDVGAARRGPMEVVVLEDGQTRVLHRYLLAAPLSGNMPRLDWEEGDRVEEGEVLAHLVPPAAPLLDPRSRAQTEARLAAAIAAQRQSASRIDRAEVASEQAQADLARQRGLRERGAVSRVAFERAEFAARAAADDLVAARLGARVAAQEVAAVRAALGMLGGARDGEQLALRAPVAGVILRVHRRDAGPVQVGAPIIEIGDPARLEAVVDVLSRDAVHIRPGSPVRIVRWGGEGVLEARVTRVEPSAFTSVSALGIEEQRVNVIIEITAPRAAWSSLGDGFRVEAEIVVWQTDDVLSAPSSAVFRRGEGWAAFVLEGGEAHLRAVDIGRRSDSRVEIEGGLAGGDTVIVHPSSRLADGDRVEPR